jgi:hypothetical protein
MLLLAFGFGCSVPFASADQFRWTGGGGNSLWSNGANWVNLTTGQPGTFPGPADDVVFEASATASAGAARNLMNSATLKLGTGAVAIHGSTISNSGTTTFLGNGINNSGGMDDVLEIRGAATISGGGELLLVEPIESAVLGGGVLTNAAGHTIRGRGVIGVSLINQGAIRAENGRLTLTASVNNAGGTIASDDDGEFYLGTGVIISSGAIDATPPMTIAGPVGAGGRLENLTTAGTIRVATTALGLAGTITNNGTLTFIANGMNNFGGFDDVYSVSGAATLAGTGELVLVEPGESGLLGAGVLTNGAAHTIRGKGSIGVELVNDGLLRAEGGKLTVTKRVAGAGRVEIGAGATLEFNGPTLSAAVITLAPSGVFDFNGERLEAAMFVGNLVLDRGTLAPGQGASPAVVSGNLQMSGSAALELQIAGVAPGEFDSLQVAGAAMVDGALVVRTVSDLGPLGTSAELTLLTAASLGGAFDDAPLVGEHLGFGVFLTGYSFDVAADRIAVVIEQQLHPGDFDADGDVDVADLSRWQIGFGQTTSATLAHGDSDGDRDVDGDDFLIWQRHLGGAGASPALALSNSGPANAQRVPNPEPSANLLALAAIIGSASAVRSAKSQLR